MAVAMILTTTTALPAEAAERQVCPVKPTVVLIHGAWADTSSWNGEVRALQQAGYDARAIGNPLRGLTSDAETVRDFLNTIKGPVVLVGHSYGGSVITNAATGDRDVKALVYVDAAAPDMGETTGQLSGKTSALAGQPATLYDQVGTDVYLKKDVFQNSFAQDSAEDRVGRALGRSAGHRDGRVHHPVAGARLAVHPVVVLHRDRRQDHRPGVAAGRWPSARSRRSTEFKGGSHLALVSHPEAVTRVIEDAICSHSLTSYRSVATAALHRQRDEQQQPRREPGREHPDAHRERGQAARPEDRPHGVLGGRAALVLLLLDERQGRAEDGGKPSQTPPSGVSPALADQAGDDRDGRAEDEPDREVAKAACAAAATRGSGPSGDPSRDHRSSPATPRPPTGSATTPIPRARRTA